MTSLICSFFLISPSTLLIQELIFTSFTMDSCNFYVINQQKKTSRNLLHDFFQTWIFFVKTSSEFEISKIKMPLFWSSFDICTKSRAFKHIIAFFLDADLNTKFFLACEGEFRRMAILHYTKWMKPNYRYKLQNPFLEGGDSLRLGTTVLVI